MSVRETEELRSGLGDLDRDYRMLIGDEWVAAASGGTSSCTDPYTGETWGSVPVAEAEDVDRAVRAARRAFGEAGWSRSSPSTRAGLLRRLGELIHEHAEELAYTQVHENGKLLRTMLDGTRRTASEVDFYAGLAESLHGTAPSTGITGMLTYSVREPVGVVAAITPWNTPLGLLAWKLWPALATGNTVVIKPSEVTPVSTLRLAELALEAGLPPGVVNVVTGFGAGAGTALVSHPGVDRIAFTGSTESGKAIMKTGAERLARVSLELGGKSPIIVFADADLESAVQGILRGSFAHTGQSCIAASRILVQRGVYDELVEMLVPRLQALRLGDPFEETTDVGPVACLPQFEKILGYIQVAKEEGAPLLTGGERPTTPDDLARGLFVPPTLFGPVSNSMRIAREEVFGPVVCVIPFDDAGDAVRIANDSPYGLAAGIWTEDVRRAYDMVGRIRAGTVWVNDYRIAHYTMPFGGFKESGVGREQGIDALHDYTEMKSVWFNFAQRD